jgi:hypothetical protein
VRQATSISQGVDSNEPGLLPDTGHTEVLLILEHAIDASHDLNDIAASDRDLTVI